MTKNSMIFLAQINDDRINATIPKELRNLARKIAAKNKMSESNYIKIAVINQVEKDLNEQQNQSN